MWEFIEANATIRFPSRTGRFLWAAARPVPQAQPQRPSLAAVDVLPRRLLRDEVLLVLGVSLGAIAVYAIVDIIGRLTARQALSQQQATLNPSQAPGRPWL